MTIYLNKVEVISEVAPLNRGLVNSTDNPLFILVGDNGISKSSLLKCIADYYGYEDSTYLKRMNMKSHIKVSSTGEFKFICVDFHAEDSRFSSSFREDMALQLSKSA
jgi:predicted ATPase